MSLLPSCSPHAVGQIEDERAKLKVAFLGGGIDSAIGQVHRIAVEMDRRFQLVAGCFSRYSDFNKTSALRYDVPIDRIYDDLPCLIEHEARNIDAIVILTPIPQHKADVVACLQARLPVICEKALAGSVLEANEIKNAIEKHEGFLAVIYNYTGYPMLRQLKAMIQSGQFGRLEQVHIEMPLEGFARLDSQGNPVTPQEWRLVDGELPTIGLDLGVHLHSIIHFLTGERPVRVVSLNDNFGAFRGIVDNTLCIARFTNDIACNIWYSKTALGHRNGLRVRIFGALGSAEWYQLEPETLYCSDNKGGRSALDRASDEGAVSAQGRYNRFKAGHPAGFIEAFANLYCDIADSLARYLKTGRTSHGEYVFGADDALEGLQMLTAMKESAKTESWVTVR